MSDRRYGTAVTPQKVFCHNISTNKFRYAVVISTRKDIFYRSFTGLLNLTSVLTIKLRYAIDQSRRWRNLPLQFFPYGLNS